MCQFFLGVQKWLRFENIKRVNAHVRLVSLKNYFCNKLHAKVESNKKQRAVRITNEHTLLLTHFSLVELLIRK